VEGLGSTYIIHLRLIGKRVVDFLVVLIELFFASCYGLGAERKYIENRRFARGWVSFGQTFAYKGTSLTNHFRTDR